MEPCSTGAVRSPATEAEDGRELLAKAVLWLHVRRYRLTNGRIGGRFIASSPAEELVTATAAEPVRVQQGNRLR